MAPLVFILSIFPGLLLLLLSILLLVAVIQALISNQQVLFRLMFFGLLVGVLWWLYMQFPAFVRRAISKLFGKSGGRNGHGH